MVKIKNKGTRVESPIIEHILVFKQFPIFSLFLNQIEQFLYYWTQIRGLQMFIESQK
jgi:hypothetical protein